MNRQALITCSYALFLLGIVGILAELMPKQPPHKTPSEQALESRVAELEQRLYRLELPPPPAVAAAEPGSKPSDVPSPTVGLDSNRPVE